MNLAGILRLRTVCNIFFLTGLFVIPAKSQTPRKPELPEETAFSMEFSFEHPVALNDAAKKAIASDPDVADVMRDEKLSVDTIPENWFTASEVHLEIHDQPDLVVMGLGISLGPYTARFWVLRHLQQGYQVVLATDAHDLTLLNTRTNGLRDIETSVKTEREKFKFDGGRYQKSPPTHDEQSSRIPAVEVQFTPEQLKEYYRVYTNSDVRYLRTLFDGYLDKSGGTVQERQLLDKWSKDYFRSKFTVLSREKNMFGGTLITILFSDRPDKVFVAWVYPEGSNEQLTLKGFDLDRFNEEDIRRIQIRYRKLIEDKTHAG
jgi:hypothetical protein